MSEYKITKSVFRKFAERVYYYANTMSLQDWELEVEIGAEKTQSRASCCTFFEDKYCKIVIDPTWDVEPTDERIDKTAHHEVCELLLAPLDALMRERFVTLPQINEARHSVIMRLQNCQCFWNTR